MPELVPMTVARLLSLVSWIGEHDGLPVADVARHFGRTMRQIRRDVEALGEIGDSLPGRSFEIDWDLYETHDRLSIRTTLGVDLPPRLTDAEATAILFGLQALADSLDDDLRKRLPHTAMAVRSLAPNAADGEDAVLRSGVDAHDGRLTGLLNATGLSRIVSFHYRSADGRESERRVHPWRVRLTASGWILDGWCETAKAPRAFSLIGMSGVVVCDEKATALDRGGDQDVPIRQITVSAEGRWVGDEFTAIDNQANADDTFTMSFHVWNEDWFETLLIDVAPALVSAPDEAKSAAGRRARRVLEAWDAYEAKETR